MGKGERNNAEEILQEQLHFLQALIDAIPNPIFYKDASGIYLGCNRAFEEYLGLKKVQIIGKTVYDISPRNLADIYHQMDRSLLDKRQVQIYEATVKYADGTEHQVIFNKAPFDKRDGTPGGLVGVILDINELKLAEDQLKRLNQALEQEVTERKRAQEELELKNTILNTQQDASPDAILVVGENGQIISCNQQFMALWQLPAQLESDHLEAPVLQAVVAQVEHPHAFLARVQHLYQHRTEKGHEEIELKDGRILNRYSAPLTGTDGKYYGRVWYFRDITERKKTEELIWTQAFNDALTHLPNRRLLHDRLKQAVSASKRSGLYGAVMFIDLDNFKPLNDTHGHDVGDLLLMEVAHRITACVRAIDTVARFGGDEFVVMLSEFDVDKARSANQARDVAEKIRVTLAQPYFLTCVQDGALETTVEHHCTASIGVALFVNQDNPEADILKFADRAMYKAKDSGRNTVHFFEASLNPKAYR